jgi:adenylate cyclase
MEHRVSSLSEGQRLLAAIMVTDAVGFSTRMSVDEGLTLRLIDRDLSLIAQVCGEFGGTVLKSTGDGLLMYFFSAVEAVSCGLEMQRRLTDLALGLGPNQYLEHRIGIHLGDIVVSEQDVMGNGVNITARLQTYAKPRGLCVSQTIFDVVKARLNLHATFLGPLHLKNIHEPVPAYQLALQDEADTGPSSTGGSPHTLPMTPDALLGMAIRTLTTDAQSTRIKKLLFATYQQAWENDPTVLEQFDLHSLLSSLRDRYPTLDDLDHQFQRVVLGLNRQSLYSEVAALILRELQPWYVRTLCPTPQELQNDATVLTVRSLEERCHLVAQNLKQHSDSLRLVKLLYCLSHKVWENDATVLEQIDISHLVQQVLQVAPQSQDLRYHLSRIVKRLNRRREYTRLANELISQFQGLYQNHPLGTQLSAPSGSEGLDSAPDHTVVKVSTPNPPSPVAADLTTLQSSLENIAPPTWEPSTEENPDRPRRDRAFLFDLRVHILQYANPLRAKVLLHSCLYGPFGYTPQDWGNLSRNTLDDLLRQTFTYCPSHADLDSKLTIMAHCMEQSDEGIAVANIIIQAMRAYYPGNPEANLAIAEAEDSPAAMPTNRVQSALPQPSPAAGSPFLSSALSST